MPSSHPNIPAVEDPDFTNTRLASHFSFPCLHPSLLLKAPQQSVTIPVTRMTPAALFNRRSHLRRE
jgi:hypothetical protein